MIQSYRLCLGAIINRLPDRLKRATVDAALWHLERTTYLRLRDKGFQPSAIIDIGAHRGDWTRSVKSVFPAPPVLMIEARGEMRNELAEVTADYPNVTYKIALLGSRARDSVTFYVQGSGSSIYREQSDTVSVPITTTMTTLDAITSSLEPPVFLKLDVQGAELEVLRGATTTLRKSEIVQLETPLTGYNEGAPTIQETISFMTDNDFALYDIAGFVRPFDEHLVQLDLVFVRNGSKLQPPKYFEFKTDA